jgi:transposase-like protein
MPPDLDDDLSKRLVERYELYQAGLSDRAISRIQGVNHSTISEWRRLKGLAINNNAHVTLKLRSKNAAPSAPPLLGICRISPERAKLRRELYDAGYTDPAIAKAVGILNKSVFKWRKQAGLPPNVPPGRSARSSSTVAVVTPDLKRRAMALLERGVGPRTIAREMAASIQSLERWRTAMLSERPELRRQASHRKVPRHPGGRLYSKLLPDRRARAFVLYADGLCDYEIAKDLGVRKTQIWEWRHALFLPAVGKSRQKHMVKPKPKQLGQAISPMSNPLYAHIVNSIGRGMAPDLVDDAVSDVWLALAEGRLSPQQISAEAGKFRNRVIGSYASKFGPRSLDEDIGDGDGFRMLDMLKDHSSSDWLERMGATVW